MRGRVQGVGFRPTVWRLARELGLDGEVLNDGAGVLIRARGRDGDIDALLDRLARDPPPLARIDRIERREWAAPRPAPVSGSPKAKLARGTPKSRPTPRSAPSAPPRR